MDLKLNRNTLLKLNDSELMELLEDLTGFSLFSMSLDWRKSDEFILKCKGVEGDVVVYWK